MRNGGDYMEENVIKDDEYRISITKWNEREAYYTVHRIEQNSTFNTEIARGSTFIFLWGDVVEKAKREAERDVERDKKYLKAINNKTEYTV